MEAARGSQAPHAPGQTDEGVLDEVFRETANTGQQVRERKGLGRVPDVPFAQHPAFDPDRLHVRLHLRPLETPTRSTDGWCRCSDERCRPWASSFAAVSIKSGSRGPQEVLTRKRPTWRPRNGHARAHAPPRPLPG